MSYLARLIEEGGDNDNGDDEILVDPRTIEAIKRIITYDIDTIAEIPINYGTATLRLNSKSAAEFLTNYYNKKKKRKYDYYNNYNQNLNNNNTSNRKSPIINGIQQYVSSNWISIVVVLLSLLIIGIGVYYIRFYHWDWIKKQWLGIWNTSSSSSTTTTLETNNSIDNDDCNNETKSSIDSDYHASTKNKSSNDRGRGGVPETITIPTTNPILGPPTKKYTKTYKDKMQHTKVVQKYARHNNKNKKTIVLSTTNRPPVFMDDNGKTNTSDRKTRCTMEEKSLQQQQPTLHKNNPSSSYNIADNDNVPGLKQEQGGNRIQSTEDTVPLSAVQQQQQQHQNQFPQNQLIGPESTMLGEMATTSIQSMMNDNMQSFSDGNNRTLTTTAKDGSVTNNIIQCVVVQNIANVTNNNIQIGNTVVDNETTERHRQEDMAVKREVGDWSKQLIEQRKLCDDALFKITSTGSFRCLVVFTLEVLLSLSDTISDACPEFWIINVVPETTSTSIWKSYLYDIMPTGMWNVINAIYSVISMLAVILIIWVLSTVRNWVIPHDMVASAFYGVALIATCIYYEWIDIRPIFGLFILQFCFHCAFRKYIDNTYEQLKTKFMNNDSQRSPPSRSEFSDSYFTFDNIERKFKGIQNGILCVCLLILITRHWDMIIEPLLRKQLLER